MANEKHVQLARLIASIPEKTATKVAVVTKQEAQCVKKHITEELDARLGPRLEESRFSTGQAITAHMAQERARLKFQETSLRHCLVQRKEEEREQQHAAKQRGEQQTAKWQRKKKSD